VSDHNKANEQRTVIGRGPPIMGDLTKRELFAAMAMQAILSNPSCRVTPAAGCTDQEAVGDLACSYTDAMLVALQAANGAEANEKLRAQNKELTRLLRYAAEHSSLAHLMNDSWREDAQAALKEVQP